MRIKEIAKRRNITQLYGKEINVTLEDALISPESLRLILGGQLNEASTEKKVTVRRTAEVEIATENTLPAKFEDDYNTEVTVAPTEYKFLNLTTGVRGQVKADEATLTAAVGDRLRIFWDEERDGTTGKEAVQIVISPNTFPGTSSRKLMCA